MNRKCPNQKGCGGITGNTQGCHGNHGTADGRVVGYLRSPDSVRTSFTEHLRRPGTILGAGVGHKVGQSRSHAGKETDSQANAKGADNVHKLSLYFL